jgi:hypothetical protein
VSLTFSTIQFVLGVYGLVSLCSISNSLHTLSKAHSKSYLHLWFLRENSFQLSVRIYSILKGKKSIVLLRKLAAVCASLLG